MTESAALSEIRAARRLHFTRRPASVSQSDWWQPEGEPLVAWEIRRMIDGARRGLAKRQAGYPADDLTDAETGAWNARITAFSALDAGTDV